MKLCVLCCVKLCVLCTVKLCVLCSLPILIQHLILLNVVHVALYEYGDFLHGTGSIFVMPSLHNILMEYMLEV